MRMKSGTVFGIIMIVAFVLAVGSALISRRQMVNWLDQGGPHSEPSEGAQAISGADIPGLPQAAADTAFAHNFKPAPDSLQPVAAPILTETGKTEWGDVFLGHWTLLNLWATWCTPCLLELPDFDMLAGELEGTGVEVIALQTGPMGQSEVSVAAARAQFDKLGVTNLAPWADGSDDQAAWMNGLARWRAGGDFSMPTTLLIDPRGRIVAVTAGARLSGLEKGADPMKLKPGEVTTHWGKPEAEAFLRALSDKNSQS